MKKLMIGGCARACLALAAAGAASVAGATDVTISELMGSHTWALKDGSAWQSGNWSTASNWGITNTTSWAEADAAPGKDDVVWFRGSGAYTVTLDGDAAATNVFVGCADAGGAPKVTLDLAGHTLAVGNAVRVGWAWMAPKLTVQGGGTLKIEKRLHAGFDSNRQSTYAATFTATGEGTKVQVGNMTSWGFRAEATDVDAFDILDGASFETTETNQSFIIGSGATGVGRNVYTFSGQGTTATLRGGFRSSANRIETRVMDGAKMDVSGIAGDNQWGSPWRSFVVGQHASNNRFVVDNATVTVTNYTAFVGYCDAAKVSQDVLCVTNNGVFTLNNVALAVGRCSSAGAATGSISNAVEVVDGGKIVGTGANASLQLGHSGQSYGNRLVVRDGSIEIPKIVIGTAYNGIATNCVASIGGSKAKVVCSLSGSSTGAFQVNQRGTLEFTLGADGFEATPLQLPNGKVTIETQGGYDAQAGYFWPEATRGAMPSLVIRDEGFAKAHPQTEQTLIECGVACPNALTMLATNLTVVASREWQTKGTVSVSEDGKKLVYKSPSAPGLLFIVR